MNLVSASSPSPQLNQEFELASAAEVEVDNRFNSRAFVKNEKISHSSNQFQLPFNNKNELNNEKEQLDNYGHLNLFKTIYSSSSSLMSSQSSIPRLILLKDPTFSSRVRLTFPHHTPIINQLNLIDTLFKTQFSEIKDPVPLMTEHLNFLKISCRELARKHGPLHPQAHNCAKRFNEFKLFITLLSKYETTFQEPTNSRRAQNFCIHLKNALQQLRFLVDQDVTEYKTHLNEIFRDLETDFVALKDFGLELKKLDESVDSIDMDLNMYCGTNHLNSASLKQARDVVNRYLLLVFASVQK